jgi:hypothetical protein
MLPMRVEGDLVREPYTRLGFSPSAILMPRGAPAKSIRVTSAEGLSLTTADSPPIRLPLPGRICTVVTPPARALSNSGSSAQTESTAFTDGMIGSVSSLPSLLASTPGQG